MCGHCAGSAFAVPGIAGALARCVSATKLGWCADTGRVLGLPEPSRHDPLLMMHPPDDVEDAMQPSFEAVMCGKSMDLILSHL